jgi:hypothetical protein
MVGKNKRSIIKIQSDGENEGKMEKKISIFRAIPQMEMITTQLNEENFPMTTLEKKLVGAEPLRLTNVEDKRINIPTQNDETNF